MSLRITLLLGAVVALSGCANMWKDEVKVPVAVHAQPPVDPFAEFEQKRQSEGLLAEQTLQSVAGFGYDTYVPQNKGYEVTDDFSLQSQTLNGFDRFMVDIPFKARKTPDYKMAASSMQSLARNLADLRGAAKLIFLFSPRDAREQKIKPFSVVESTQQGNPVTITIASSKDVPVRKGMFSVIVEGAPLDSPEYRSAANERLTAHRLPIEKSTESFTCNRGMKFSIEFERDATSETADAATLIMPRNKREALARTHAGTGQNFASSRIKFHKGDSGNKTELSVVSDTGRATKYTCRNIRS